MKRIFFMAGLLLIASLGLFYLSLPDQKARLVFCDVGQGDAALLIRGTFQLLVDTGPSNGAVVACLEHHMPFWDKTIEGIIISHGDSDHSGGLAAIRRYFTVSNIWSNEQNNYSKKLTESDTIRSEWFTFEVVSPENWGEETVGENDQSIVGILGVGGTSIMFTGDAGSEVEQRLVWRGLLRLSSGRLDVLKVSHHGSAAGTSEELLASLQPRLAVISVGKNSFGHPTAAVLERLRRYGATVWRTDQQGEKVLNLL